MNGLDTYQKRKVDRQIVAICRVYGVTELYTDDKGLAARARLCGISPIAIEEVAIPDKARQGSLQLEKHEEIPAADNGSNEEENQPIEPV